MYIPICIHIGIYIYIYIDVCVLGGGARRIFMCIGDSIGTLSPLCASACQFSRNSWVKAAESCGDVTKGKWRLANPRGSVR